MKKAVLLHFVFLSMFSNMEAQDIELHSVTTTRQPGGDFGYTLDGIRMIDFATAKLWNPDYFGDGIYPKFINLTNAYSASGSLEQITSGDNIDLFFFGTFNKLEPSLNQFTEAEIDSLYAWSERGGKLIIGASASFPDYDFDPSTLNDRWGFGVELVPVLTPPSQQILPTANGLNSVIFEGPFGSVSMANQGGAAQGYFNAMPAEAVVLGVDADGRPTLILDCNTLDLIISDLDAFTDLGGISQGLEIQNSNDTFLLNTIVYMDQLQGPPVVTQNGNVLSAGSYLSYQWILNNEPINGATDSTYTATEEGNYSVKVSMSCGCEATSEAQYIALTNTEIVFLENQINIYPNPVTAYLTIEFTLLKSTSIELNVYNSSGQLMSSPTPSLMLTEGKHSIMMNVSGWPTGVYEVELATDAGKKAIKFIK